MRTRAGSGNHPRSQGRRGDPHLRAADTQGLLYRVVRAFVVLGLRIQWADIRTLSGRAADSFSLTGRQGKAVDWSATLPDLLAEIRQGTD